MSFLNRINLNKDNSNKNHDSQKKESENISNIFNSIKNNYRKNTMGFDLNSFKQKASELYNEASRKVKQYTPESFSKEKKFVNAIVATLALMVLADKKVETEEVTSSLDTIANIDEINELDMQQEAIELFELHIEKLQPLLSNNVKWVIEVAKLIGDISKVKEYPEYVPMIEALIDYISNSDGNMHPLEVEMKNKILDVLK